MKKQDIEDDDHVHQPKSPIKLLVVVLILLSCLVLLALISRFHSSYSFPSSWKLTSSSNHEDLMKKLRQSVTFLPLKDMRYTESPTAGHTWFMSSMNDSQEEGEVQHLHFPSESSRGRLLCLKGRNIHDGAWNYYGLAWPEALPENATLKEGLTFVSNAHYVYDNIWHGLSATVPFVAWHLRNGCREPARWILYYKGELRTTIPPWLSNLIQAVYHTQPVNIEGLEGYEEAPMCFEEAVVARHNEGGLSREKLEEVFDHLRCKARAYCNVKTEKNTRDVRVTMLLRRGGRSFKNDTHVIGIFQTECRKIEGCRLQVAYSNNLTVCQQVKVMSETDVLISSHGAQLTNLFLMDKGSNIMEFFPKGWLKLAGVGQLVFQWLSGWSGMHHQGEWHDSKGPPCQYPEDDDRCMPVYKNAQIGHNETHFRDWAQTVFSEARARKVDGISKAKESHHFGCVCE